MPFTRQATAGIPSALFTVNSLAATRAAVNYAQEKPDFDEQPESAPAGILLEPVDMRKLAADMVFWIFELPHFLQVTSRTASHDVTNDSKSARHSWQRNS